MAGYLAPSINVYGGFEIGNGGLVQSQNVTVFGGAFSATNGVSTIITETVNIENGDVNLYPKSNLHITGGVAISNSTILVMIGLTPLPTAYVQVAGNVSITKGSLKVSFEALATPSETTTYYLLSAAHISGNFENWGLVGLSGGVLTMLPVNDSMLAFTYTPPAPVTPETPRNLIYLYVFLPIGLVLAAVIAFFVRRRFFHVVVVNTTKPHVYSPLPKRKDTI